MLFRGPNQMSKLYVPVRSPVVGGVYWMELLHERSSTKVYVLVEVDRIKEVEGLVEVVVVGSDNTILLDSVSSLYEVKGRED